LLGSEPTGRLSRTSLIRQGVAAVRLNGNTIHSVGGLSSNNGSFASGARTLAATPKTPPSTLDSLIRWCGRDWLPTFIQSPISGSRVRVPSTRSSTSCDFYSARQCAADIGGYRRPRTRRIVPLRSVVQPYGTRAALMGGPEKPESRRVVATKRRQGSTDNAINVLIDRAMHGYYTERLAAEGLRAC
jgi:hypothetical protein